MSCGCKLQMWLGSRFAVAVADAGSCSSDSTSSLETSLCHGYGSKKTKNQTYQPKKNKKGVRGKNELWQNGPKATKRANPIRRKNQSKIKYSKSCSPTPQSRSQEFEYTLFIWEVTTDTVED